MFRIVPKTIRLISNFEQLKVVSLYNVVDIQLLISGNRTNIFIYIVVF